MREALARAYYRSGRFAAAEREFSAALDLEPVNDYAHYGLGLCRLRAGDRTGARGHLRLATVMRPDNADYRARSSRLPTPTRRPTRPLTRPPVPRSRARSEHRGRGQPSGRVLRSRRRGVARRDADPRRGGRHRAPARRGAACRVPDQQLEPARRRLRRAARGRRASRPSPTTCARARRPRPRCSRPAWPAGARVLACAGPGVVEALARPRASRSSTPRPADCGRGRRLSPRLRLRALAPRGRRRAVRGAVRRDEPRPDLSGRRGLLPGRVRSWPRSRPRPVAGPRSRASPNRRWRRSCARGTATRA